MTISNELKKLSLPAVLSLGILFYPAQEAQAATLSPEPQQIDLRTWTQEGSPQNGQWQVYHDGTLVRQKTNGDPTFFVSPDDFIDTTINGTFKVSHSDDDFIGFVFGYKSPIAANGDGVNEMEFLLFDWKQSGQGSAKEGFSLSKVNGNINEYARGFWGHKSSADFKVIATNYNSRNGWKNNTEYDFSLLYQSDRIKIDINGNTIFDVSADEVGEEFQPGRFGFYNYSQANVYYGGFTMAETPPETVPEPSLLLGLLVFGAVGVTGLKRKKQPYSQDYSVR